MKRKPALVAVFALTAAMAAWFIVEGTQWYDITRTSGFSSEGIGGKYAAPGELASKMIRDARERLQVVGISAAVSIDGQVVWAGAAGFAEIGETPRSLDTNTAFRIGATTQSATQNPMLASLIDHAPRHLDGIAEFYEVKHGLARQKRTAGQIQTLPDGERLATSSDLARLCGSAPPNATARYEYGGVSSGAMTWLVCYPESRLGVAININSRLDNFSDLTDLEPPISRLYSGLAQDGNLRTAAASPAGR